MLETMLFLRFSSEVSPSLLHRWSIAAPSLLHRIDGLDMELIWSNDGVSTLEKRKESGKAVKKIR